MITDVFDFYVEKVHKLVYTMYKSWILYNLTLYNN